MLRLFQKITKKLSIKAIVLLGVYIMALIILVFALTMAYLSSTIKYDQNTLKDIINLEQENQKILNTIKNITYLDNQILVVEDMKKLYDLEDDLLGDIRYDKVYNEKNEDTFSKYNDEIIKIVALLNGRIDLQKEVFESKGIVLFYKNEIDTYKLKVEKQINSIQNETESIYGKASLLTKRHARNLKKGIPRSDMDINLSFDLNRVMTISKDLDNSILKLPLYLNTIIRATNEDVINSINLNNLSQLITLFENSLIRIKNIKYEHNHLKDSLGKIDERFMKIRELITLIISAKKQILKEQKRFEEFSKVANGLNIKIFDNVNALDNLTGKIKFSILNHSDNISKRTTYIIIIVGVVFFILIFFAASTLISRINLPLEFIMRYIDNIVAKKRDLNSNIPIVTDDEFGKLSYSFNNMTSTISNNINEIEDLYKEIEDTQKEVIFTMGAIGETRSKETGNHVKRVAEYSKILALKYGIPYEEAELLKMASPMHDIGKVGIPDSILKKPESLNKDEWEVMKSHATLGYDMLKHSNRDILKAAAIVAHEHHEKWDGTGYPRGIDGENIHIYGRITAIADVFDALGSDRCYPDSWPITKILNFFEDNKSKHFDPKLVDLFLENIDEFVYIRDKYKDIFD